MARNVLRHSSTARNASGIAILLDAESSRVLSRMLFAALAKPTPGRTETNLAREHILSAETGFLLNGMALDPTCFSPMGSESSPKAGDCITLKSKPNLWQLCATDARADKIR